MKCHHGFDSMQTFRWAFQTNVSDEQGSHSWAACSGGIGSLPWRFISTVSAPGPSFAANVMVTTRDGSEPSRPRNL